MSQLKNNHSQTVHANSMYKFVTNLILMILAVVLLPTQSITAAQEFRVRTSTVDLVTVDGLESDIKSEIEFGRELASIILGQNKLDENKRINKYLNLVGNSIVPYSQRPELKFYFALLDTDEINAYASPGGYIFVTKGALMLMENEAELAAVLAHEIAHINQKHIVKELKIKGEDESTESSLSKLLGGLGDPAKAVLNQALDKAMSLLFTKGLKKEDEFEADRVGTLLLTAADYDPLALKRYLQKVKQQKASNLKVLYTTHPSFDDRLTKLQQLIDEEGLQRIDAPHAKYRFQQTVRN